MLKISNRSSWIAMREEENVSEATYKEIMSEHFLELMKDSNPKTQKIQQNQNRFIKRLPDQIILEILQNTKDKEILKTARMKRQTTFKGKSN